MGALNLCYLFFAFWVLEFGIWLLEFIIWCLLSLDALHHYQHAESESQKSPGA